LRDHTSKQGASDWPKAGNDIFFLVSSDGNHYGKDFNNSSFGEGEKAWESALALDAAKIEGLTKELRARLIRTTGIPTGAASTRSRSGSSPPVLKQRNLLSLPPIPRSKALSSRTTFAPLNKSLAKNEIEGH